MEWSGSSRRSSGSGTRLRLRAMPNARPPHREHASQIQKRYGYRPSSDPAESFQLLRWLYTRATLSAERPSVLFDRATARLVERKVLLPGVTVLERLVSSVRNWAVKRLWCLLSALPTPGQRATLDAMLLVPEGSRRSNLDRLRRSPTTISARALCQALERLSEIEKLGMSDLDFSRIPPGRVDALARQANAARAQAIARMPDDRRIATLVAFVSRLERTACDDALNLMDLELAKLLTEADRVGKAVNYQGNFPTSVTRVIPPFGDQHHLVSLDFRRLCLEKVFPSRFLLSGRSRGLSRASVFPVAAFAFD